MMKIVGIVLLVYLAIYEGMVLALKDKMSTTDALSTLKWDKARHGWSTLIRLSVVPLAIIPDVIHFYPMWWYSLPLLGLYIFLAWTGWNTILNLMRGKEWYYKGSVQTGTSSVLDKALKNVYLYWSLQALVIIATLVLTLTL